MIRGKIRIRCVFVALWDDFGVHEGRGFVFDIAGAHGVRQRAFGDPAGGGPRI